eukprot:gene9930-2549_t
MEDKMGLADTAAAWREVLAAAARAGGWDACDGVLAEMARRGIEVDQGGWAALIAALAGAGERDAAFDAWRLTGSRALRRWRNGAPR